MNNLDLAINKFDSISNQYPNKTAISHLTKQVSFIELQQLSYDIAQRLINEGCHKQDIIAVHMDKSIFAIAVIIAIMRIGAIYLPLDCLNPIERIKLIINDCHPKMILTDKANANIINHPNTLNVEKIKFNGLSTYNNKMNQNEICYLLYTSGSTGTPKGVLISHANLSHLLNACHELFSFTPEDKWIWYHACGFDFSIWEIFSALTTGATLFIPNAKIKNNPQSLLSFILENKITISAFTPPAYYQFIHALLCQQNTNILPLRYIITAGGKLNVEKAWHDLNHIDGLARVELVNMYGITEACIHSTFYSIKQGDSLIADSESCIGKALPGVEIKLCHFENGNMTESSIEGEICIAGPTVSSGYIKRELNTKMYYTAYDQSNKKKVYLRTGDFARFLVDGSLDFIGRKDEQIKLAGYRVELGEIENVLFQHQAIVNTKVLKINNDGDTFIVLFYQLNKKINLSQDEIEHYLAEKLPYYMIPMFFIEIPEFKLTTNGKIDKKALLELYHTTCY